ncbi:hypothetical protein [Longispora urticae]
MLTGRAVFAGQTHTWIREAVPGPGVVTLGEDTASGGLVLGSLGPYQARWTPHPGHEVHPAAVRAVWEPGVRAVTAVPALEGHLPSAALIGVALAVADDLSAARCQLLGHHMPAVTQATPPDEPAPAGHCHVPHMITTRMPDGDALADRVVWELLPASLLATVVGQPVPDEALLDAVHRRVRCWLRLRTLHRSGALPESLLGQIISHLAGRHLLTMPLIYRHAATLIALCDLEEQ